MTAEDLAESLKNRRMESIAGNPTFKKEFDLNAMFTSFNTAAFMLQLLGHNYAQTKFCPVSYLRSFLIDEKFPSAWIPSEVPATPELLLHTGLALAKTSYSILPHELIKSSKRTVVKLYVKRITNTVKSQLRNIVVV
ncbi:hypothetical protein HDU76_001701, partial [Blyttiomyces sp. JEL0837]